MGIESSRAASSPLALLPEADGPGDILQEQEEELTEPTAERHESPKVTLQRLMAWVDHPNIAKDIDPAALDTLGSLVVREYDLDEQSRAQWKDEAQKALDFAVQKADPKQYPWTDASNVIFPLITSAAMRFGAVAYPAIVPNRNVVKGIVWGDDNGTPVTQDGKPDSPPKLDKMQQPIWLVPPGAKRRRAEKIGEHMSYQLLDGMEYWEEQTDAMLHSMPIVGGAARKTFRDTREDKNASLLIDLMNLVWNMNAPSFEAAPRHTELQELYPHQILELELDDETFLPLPYGPGEAAPAQTPGPGPDKAPPDPSDTEAAHVFLEQHRRYDLDGDGYPEPLVVTVHRRSGKVVRIIARFDEEGIVSDDKTHKIKRIAALESYTLYRFLPNPKGGSYPCGFGHYLKPLNEAVNTTINQMFDAGHLQIAGGGFIGTGLSVHAGPTNFSIGEYKPVNNKGQDIRNSIFPIPWPGPNAVLFQLLGFLVGAAKEVASVQDVLTGDTAMANTPPTTMLALVDQGMKVYTAIYKRIYRALKSELKKLYRLNRQYIQEDERYRIGDTWRSVTPEDYRLGGGVEPVADPTMVTDMQRITRAALIVDRAEKSPLVNKLAAERYLFEAASIPRIDDFLPEKMPPPQDSPEMVLAKAEQAKAAGMGQKLQFEIQEAQSKLGLTRAQELKAYTEAMVNFAKAKASMTEPQVAFMEAQLAAMRLHIEALNTTVKAAAVDATIHGHNLGHHARMADVSQRAREVADEQPRPADSGGGGTIAPELPEPPSTGAVGSGLSALAPPSGDAGPPALPGAPQPGPEEGGG